MTGRLPVEHGVRDNAGFRVAASEETLAKRLHASGFRTGAFISAFPLDSRFGLAAGFDLYDDRFLDSAPRPAMLEQERSGTETVSAAVRWLRDGDGSRRWFCWVHLYEPHFPYAPPQPFTSRFAAGPYAGEVAAADAALAPLLQPILDAGPSCDTLVVVTSDHGESLGEHAEATHGIFGYDATLKVPLLLYYPRLLQPGVVTARVSHIDILPTIVEALGIAGPANLRGRSLIDAAHRAAGNNASTYFEALSGPLNRGWAPLTGVVAEGMKYIDLPIPELYDLRVDPQERRNLVRDRPQQVDELRTLLQSYGSGGSARSREPSDVRERLRSLGYVTSTAGVLGTRYTEADDPKRQLAVEARLQEVLTEYL